MTRRTWVLFAIVQFVGVVTCIGYTRFAFDAAHERLGLALWFTCRHVLLPGNLVGGALISTFRLWFRYSWYIESLPLAVVLNAGFWLVCVAASRILREHLAGIKPHRYAIAFVATTTAFILANVVHYYTQPVMYADCFFPHGVPFHLYHEGGYAGGEAIMWGGLAADMLIVVVAATFLGTAWQWRSGKGGF